MNCFQNIVGISNTSHPCFTDEFSAEARKSESGRYMDKLPEFPALDVFAAVAAFEQQTLEAKLTEARDNAITDVKEAIYKELGDRYISKSRAYIGNVGNTANTGVIALAFDYAGVVFDMTTYKGGDVKVKSLTPYFNYDGELDVKVYRGYSTGITYTGLELIKEITVNTSNASPQPQDISGLVLATTDELGKAYSYLFLYQRAEGVFPRDNSSSCGCGDKEAILFQYLKPYGIVGTAHDNILIANRTAKVNGLLVQIEARCTGGDFLCDNYYGNELIKIALEGTIQRKAVSNALLAIITSNLIHRYTEAKREQMAHSINILNSKVKNNVSWIADRMDMSNNDCFICSGGENTPYGIAIDSILL